MLLHYPTFGHVNNTPVQIDTRDCDGLSADTKTSGNSEIYLFQPKYRQ